MNIRKELENALGAAQHIQLNDLELDPLKIRAILINEAVPCDPSQDFYGRQDAAYLSTTIPLFQKAGFKTPSKIHSFFPSRSMIPSSTRFFSSLIIALRSTLRYSARVV